MTELQQTWTYLLLGFLFGGLIVGAIVHQVMGDRIKRLDYRLDSWNDCDGCNHNYEWDGRIPF